MENQNELTLKEIGDLINHGHNGLIANLDYESLQGTVEKWKKQRPQDFKFIKELPNVQDFIGVTTSYNHKKEEFIASKPEMANNLVEIAESEGINSNKFEIIDEFSEEFYQNFIEKIRNLQKESSLTKKQFLSYLMKTNNKKGITISNALDVNEGTVSSHVSRAKDKINQSKKTAKIDELMNKGNYHELREKRREILT